MKALSVVGLLLSALLTGCASSGGGVSANTTAFYTDAYEPKGSLSVVAGDPSVSGSLEFAAYKRKFERWLGYVGYEIESDPGKAEYIALVTYGIDEGKTTTVSSPIYGQTGGGATYTSGTVYGSGGSVNYSGSSYTMPSYGVVGSKTGSKTTYTRAIALDIVEASSFKEGNPQKVYEGRTKSTGSCSIIVEVFDEMLEAMFTDFPGENGRNKNRLVRGVFDC